MADDIIDKSFPYGKEAALAGAKFRDVETVDLATGQVRWVWQHVDCCMICTLCTST